MKHIILNTALLLLTVNLYAKDYKGAEIRTNESFLYGKFEVKMKSAEASGMLMSFFTFYDNPDFATNWNEIDIEILGRYTNEVQFNAIVGNHQMHEYRQVLNHNPHLDFHVYSFEWTPEYIAWQVDGKEVYKQTGDHIAKMNKPQKIMMNIWPSEFWDWTGPWDAKKLPLYAMYDYVKYYEYLPTKAEKFSLKWEDNFDKINQGRWSFATHTFDGNNCDFDPDNAYVKDGILVLSLTHATPLAADEEAKDEELADATIKSVLYINSTTVKITFSRPVNRINARKENFKIDNIEILKSKFDMDMVNVELTTAAFDWDEKKKIEFVPPEKSVIKSTLVVPITK